MQNFVCRKNIELYRKLLAGPLDEAKRGVVEALLTKEQATEQAQLLAPRDR